MSDRCTGACCRQFFLPVCPEGLRALYDAAKAGETSATWTERDGTERTGQVVDEIELIFPMVRHVGYFEGVPEFMELREGEKYVPGHYYRCVHLGEDGDCGIYDIRPSMCRDYPYGQRCRYRGCTWDAADEDGAGSDSGRSRIAEDWQRRHKGGLKP